MHASVRHFVEEQVAKYACADLPTLEVGSLDVNGGVRDLFTGHYLGTDMRDGPGVDRVVNAHDLDMIDDAQLSNDGQGWKVIVCLEMMEHDDMPWESVVAMRGVAAPGAILILTCRGYNERGCFPVHGYPHDHWRYSPTGLKALLEWGGWTPLEIRDDPQDPGVLSISQLK